MPATKYPGERYGHTTHEIYVAYPFWLLGIDYVEVVVIFLLSVVVQCLACTIPYLPVNPD